MIESRHDLYPGCEVVCVDDQVPLIDGTVVKDKAITEGEVYTVEWVGIVSNYVFGEYLGVILKDVSSRFGAENAQPHAPYAARRFRPIVKDPIAVLRQIAADPNGYRPDAPEGPVRDEPLPDDGEGVKEREKEEV